MVKEVPATFATTDGQSFEDKKDAERHQALLDAFAAFHDAEARLNRELMENATTADGIRFSFEPWSYYRVQEWWPGMPTLEKVDTLSLLTEARACEARVHREGEDVVLVYYRSRANERGYQRQEVSIGSLYRLETNALRALAIAQREWLSEATKTVEETETKAGIHHAK